MLPKANVDNGEVRQRINSLFIELFQTDPSKLKPDQRLFEDLGLDSLDAVDLGLRFQKQFHINASPSDLIDIKTLGDVYRFVENNQSMDKSAHDIWWNTLLDIWWIYLGQSFPVKKGPDTFAGAFTI